MVLVSTEEIIIKTTSVKVQSVKHLPAVKRQR
jgi:hypothetical protein